MTDTSRKFFSSRRPLFKPLLLAVACSMATQGLAGPEGGVVVGGSGTINQSGTTTTINQSTQRMAIDWQSYDLNANERVNYIQPDSSSVSLNRILSNRGSQIHGRIDANGHVILVNPNGILFGKGAVINAGGVLASGLTIDPNDFMNGDFTFRALEDSDGVVFNSGVINAATGGDVALIGKEVKNEGLITAQLGSVTLAAGKEAVVTFDGEGMLGVRVSEAILQDEIGVDAAVVNEGTISAEEGQILLSASTSQEIFTQAVNTGNLRHSTSVVVNDDGSFTLGAGADVVNTGTLTTSGEQGGEIVLLGENVTSSGEILADSSVAAEAGAIEVHSVDTTWLSEDSLVSAEAVQGSGGDIKVLGKNVGLKDYATVSASGTNGGGQVLIGGDEIGSNTQVRNAEFIYLGETTQVSADALEEGDGGRIITFAEDTARIKGELTARGGASGGDGGFIETSGLKGFVIDTVPDMSTPNGRGGEWLIDPYDILIRNIGEDDDQFTNDSSPFVSTVGVSTLSVTAITDALNSSEGSIVRIQTGLNATDGDDDGNITFATELDYQGTNSSTLILNAHNNINTQGNDITSNNASLNLILNADFDNNNSGSIVLDNSNITTNGGNITINAPLDLDGGGTFTLNTRSASAANGDITINGDVNALTSGNNAESLSINTGTGDLTITGAVGNVGQLDNLTIASAGAINLGTEGVIGGVSANRITVTQSASFDTHGFDLSTMTGGAGGDVIVNSTGAIRVGNISTQGQGLRAGNGQAGGAITLNGSDITADVLNAFGSDARDDRDRNGGQGASVNLTATGGTINVEDINTFSGDSGDKNAGVDGGDVRLQAAQISVGNANGSGGIDTHGGDHGGEEDKDEGNLGGLGGAVTLTATGTDDLQASITLYGSLDTRSGLNQNGTTRPASTRASLSLIGTGGTVNLNPANETAYQYGLDITGSAGTDTLTLGANSGTHTWQINTPTSGSLNADVLFSDIETINGSDGGDDTFVLRSQEEFNGTIDARGNGAAGDTVEYPRPGPLLVTLGQDISGVLNAENLQGSGANSSLEILNSEGNNPVNWMIDSANAGSVSLDTESLNFSNFGSLIGSDALADVFDFTDQGSLSGSVNGGNGANVTDSILGRTQASEWQLTGDRSGVLTTTARVAGFSDIELLEGRSSDDTLIGEAQNNTWTISTLDAGHVVSTDDDGSLADQVRFTGMENLRGAAGDFADVFLIGASLSGIIDGATGTDQLVSAASTGTNLWQISSANGGLLTNDSVSVTYSNIEQLKGSDNIVDAFTLSSGVNFAGQMDGGSGASVDSLAAVDGDNTWTLNEGASAANLGGTINTNGAFVGIEQLNGGTGTDTLEGADQNTAWTINDSEDSLTQTFDDDSTASVAFSGMEALTGGSAIDTFDLDADFAGTLNGGDNNDVFHIGAALTTARLEGGNDSDRFVLETGGSVLNTSTIDGGEGSDTLLGRNEATTWTVDTEHGGQVAVTNDATYVQRFDNIEGLVGSNAFADQFNFTTPTASIEDIVAGDSAGDVADYSAVDAPITVRLSTESDTGLTGIERVVGNNSGRDGDGRPDSTLIGPNSTNNWQIGDFDGSDSTADGINDGTAAGTEFVNFNQLLGGDQNDTFTFRSDTPAAIRSGDNRPGRIDGGLDTGGNDDVIIGRDVVTTWSISEGNTGDAGNEYAEGHFYYDDGRTGISQTQFVGIERLEGSDSAVDAFNVGNFTVGSDQQARGFRITLDGGEGDAEDSITLPEQDLAITIGQAVGGLGLVGLETINADANYNNRLTFSSAANQTVDWQVTDENQGTVSLLLDNTITSFSNFGTLLGGDGNDLFTFNSNAAVTESVNGGAGSNTLIGREDNNTVYALDSFNRGTVTGDGGDYIPGFDNIQNLQARSDNDELVAPVANNASNTWLIGNTNTLNNDLSFTGFEAYTGNVGVDHFILEGETSALVIRGAPAGVADNVTDILTINRAAGNEVTWEINGTGQGSVSDVNGEVLFDQIERLEAGEANDRFELNGSAAIAMEIDGGAGNDTLLGAFRGLDQANNWLIGTDNTLNVSLLFNEIENYVGNAGPDNFVLQSGSIAGEVRGTDPSLNNHADDTLSVLSQAGSDVNWTLTADAEGTVDGIGGGFYSIEGLQGSAGNDQFTVFSADAVRIDVNGGNGDDTLMSANRGAESNTWLIGLNNTLNRNLDFAGIENFTGNVGSDYFTLETGVVAGAIRGAADGVSDNLGSDTLQVNSSTFQSVAWTISGDGQGVVNRQGATDFLGMENLVGGQGADTFTFSNPQAALRGLIDGGESVNALGEIADNLNVATFTQGVVVELGPVAVPGSLVASAVGLPNVNAHNIENVVAYNDTSATANTLNSTENNNWIAISDVADPPALQWQLTPFNDGFVRQLVTPADPDEDLNTNNVVPNTRVNFFNFGSIKGGNGRVSDNIDIGFNLTGNYELGSGARSLNFATRLGLVVVDLQNNIEQVIGNGNTLIRITPESDLNGDNTWQITGENRGVLNVLIEGADDYNLTFSGVNQLEGGTGNDVFRFVRGEANAQGIFNSVLIDGSIHGGLLQQDGIGNSSVNEVFVANDVDNAFTFGVSELETVQAAVRFPTSQAPVSIVRNRDGVTDLYNIAQLQVDNNPAQPHVLLSGDTANYTWTIDNLMSLRRDGEDLIGQTLTFRGIDRIAGGEGNDTFNVLRLDELDNIYNGGLGSDRLNLANVESPFTVYVDRGADASRAQGEVDMLAIESLVGNQDSRLVASDRINTWSFTSGENVGQLNNTLDFEGFGTLDGGSDIDIFTLNGGRFNGTINARGGADLLDLTFDSRADQALTFNGGDSDAMLDSVRLSGDLADYTGSYLPNLAAGTQISYTNSVTRLGQTVNFNEVSQVEDNTIASELQINRPAFSNASTILLGDDRFRVDDYTVVNVSGKDSLSVLASRSDTILIDGPVNLDGQLTLSGANVRMAEPEMGQTADSLINVNTLFLDGIAGAGSAASETQAAAPIQTNIVDLRINDANGPIFLREQNALNITELNTRATLDIEVAFGDLSSTSDLSANDLNLLMGNGDILLSGDNSFNGVINARTPGHSISFNNGPTQLGTIEAANLTVNAQGDIRDDGEAVINVSGRTDLAAVGGNIVLDHAEHNFDVLSVRDAVDLTVRDQNSLILETITARGNMTFNAGGDIALGSLEAVNGTVNLDSGGALTDNNGGDVNILADSLVFRSETGFGSQDNAIETSIAVLDGENAAGRINVVNDQAVTVNALRNNGSITLANTGTVTLGPAPTYDRSAEDARQAGGVINGNYNDEDSVVTLIVNDGALTTTGSLNVTRPELVGNSFAISTTGGLGVSRPLVMFSPGDIFVVGSGIFPVGAFNTSLRGQLTGPGQLTSTTFLSNVDDLLVEVEAIEQIDPAIFSDVRLFLHDNIAIRMPRDQLYEDDLEEYEEQ